MNTAYMECLKETDTGKVAETMLAEKMRKAKTERQRLLEIDGNRKKVQSLKLEKQALLQQIETAKMSIEEALRKKSESENVITHSQQRIAVIDKHIIGLKKTKKYLQDRLAA